MSLPILEQLARFASERTYDSLPRPVIESVKRRILDTVGVAVAAYEQRTADGIAAMVAESGGAPQATLIGRADRAPAAMAAFYNGTLAHSLDFDDTHLPSVLHPSAAVTPAALAVAEATSADSRALIGAIAVGIEVTIRTGMGTRPRSAERWAPPQRRRSCLVLTESASPTPSVSRPAWVPASSRRTALAAP